MIRNIVLGMIAPVALATNILAVTEASAQRAPGPRGGPGMAQAMRPGGGPVMGRPRGPGASYRPAPGFRPPPPGSYRSGYYRRGYYGYGPGYWGAPRGYYYDNGAAAALGILGGLAVGGAIAAGSPYYEECRIVPQRVWVPGRGYRIRDVRICD